MPRARSTGVLLVTLAIGILAATVFSEILAQIIEPSSVVYRVLIQSFVYEIGPLNLSLVMVSFTLGLKLNINLLTIMSMMAAYYYWKYRV
jgi:hypothetical protein